MNILNSLNPLNDGMAKMLKNGVIMDVSSIEEAMIAEKAGACAVMALDMIPSKIRQHGGIARMSDVSLIENIKKNITFANRPKYVTGKNILFVDGGFTRTMLRYGVALSFDNIFSFRCSNKDFHYNLPYKNVTLLQDERVYNDQDNKISINYKKKIKFNIFKDIKKPLTEAALLYITSNCRKLCDDSIIDIIAQYKFDKYVILSNDKNYKKRFKPFKNIDFPVMPVKNIFERFNTYIYTPTEDNFDCSPRFIAECSFYNKNVLYHDIDDNYLEIDTGLKYRKYDIENDFKGITLQDDDDIIEIIKSNI